MRLVVAAVATLALAVPAAADAAILQPIKPCYVSVDDDLREEVVLAGSGYAPNEVLEILVDGTIIDGVVSDDNGEFGPHVIKAPPRGDGLPRAFRVQVRSRNDPSNQDTLRSLVSALVMRVKPAHAPARARVTWIGRGFTTGSAVYAHYLLAGKHKRTVRLARTSGPCGFFKVRKRQFPFTPKVGRWRVRVDTRRRYAKTPVGVFYSLKFDVFRAG